MLRQVQQQKLAQKLSPQQIQLMKLLQVSTADLEGRIKEELEINPALEDGYSEATEDPYQLDEVPNKEKEAEQEEDIIDSYLQDDVNEYLRSENDEPSDYYIYDQNTDDEEKSDSSLPRVEHTLHDFLNNQLGMLSLNQTEQLIAHQIIGSIDDDGYLRRAPLSIMDDLAFKYNELTDLETVESVLEKIQNFEPAGIGAQDLQECLLLQLHKSEREDVSVQNAILILSEYYDEFIKKHYNKIQQRAKLSVEEFKDAIHVILKLTPKPGIAFSHDSSKTTNYVIPDFFVYNNNGQLELSLNARNAPELRVSPNYIEMLKSYDSAGGKFNKEEKEALLFIKQKIDSAKWFIEAIKQRQQTLILVMNAIMHYQKDFFFSGDEVDLKPMILKDIAELIQMDISTVSRVANSKYVQTEFGLFLLKFFFSEGIVHESGEEVSTREVKRLLQEIVDGENKKKPFSDQKLTEKLMKNGFEVARRTVAKYREQLGIPVARLRKEA